MSKSKCAQQDLFEDLKTFGKGRQCEIYACSGDIYRGRLRSISWDGLGLVMKFYWLCKHRRSANHLGECEDRWSEVVSPFRNFHPINFEYREHRLIPGKKQIEIRGARGERCFIYSGEDETNLINVDGEFIPKNKLQSK